MNESLRLTALFVRDLLAYDEQLIRIGRQNYDITDFTIGYIGVDSLGSARRLASGEKFDGTLEQMTYQQQMAGTGYAVILRSLTHGQRPQPLPLLIQSQKALELQESLGIGVYQASGLTDVKMLTGQQYGERARADAECTICNDCGC